MQSTKEQRQFIIFLSLSASDILLPIHLCCTLFSTVWTGGDNVRLDLEGEKNESVVALSDSITLLNKKNRSYYEFRISS